MLPLVRHVKIFLEGTWGCTWTTSSCARSTRSLALLSAVGMRRTTCMSSKRKTAYADRGPDSGACACRALAALRFPACGSSRPAPAAVLDALLLLLLLAAGARSGVVVQLVKSLCSESGVLIETRYADASAVDDLRHLSLSLSLSPPATSATSSCQLVGCQQAALTQWINGTCPP